MSEHPQLLRQVRRLDAHLGLEVADRSFAVDKDLEDADARRMCERAEQVSLHLGQGATLEHGPGHGGVPRRSSSDNIVR